ncbi:NADP-dependent oxidoreductase [Pseudonocardia alni]|uniref:NADP-dependent oxidoreductase n=1 Tax=Pseudonocardia alni TaxID=33907 RepID=UPI00280AF016|nr:NADP-dependent oxidoreductase [Pseudonocardia alni]
MSSRPAAHRAHLLAHRPDRGSTEPLLRWTEVPTPAVGPGQALVRTELLSVDPASRVFMSEIRSDLPPVAIGAVMRGYGIGQVVESRRADLPVGARVSGWTGWQEYQLADDAQLEEPFTVLPQPSRGTAPVPSEHALGVLGLTGITAWLGVESTDPRPGETFLVAAAAGAVGSVAGQLARERGARVVGIAGGSDKCRYVVDELGFDACVDRHDPRWREILDAATPDGIDADLETAGGEIFDRVLTRITPGARIALVGMIADYHADPQRRHGLRNLIEVAEQRAVVRGLLVTDHSDRFEEITSQLAIRLTDGRLRAVHDVVDGLENAPAALDRVFDGTGRGKILVRVHSSDDER